MEIRVTEEDLRNLVRSQAIQLADKDATIAALSRIITELEMAQAAEQNAKAKAKSKQLFQENTMPRGKGTYGSKVGRPPKKNKKTAAKKGMSRRKK